MLQLAQGRALEFILEELEALDYKWAYRVVDARAFGLPQRRERVFLVAALDEDPRNVLLVDNQPEPARVPSEIGRVACGFYWTEGTRGLGWATDAVPTLKGGSTIGIPSPPAILFPDGRLKALDIRDAERLQGFPVNYTKPAESVARAGSRWKLVGNALNSTVAEWIGNCLAKPGHYDDSWDSMILEPGGRWPRAAWNLGKVRRKASVSAWPKRHSRKPLSSFLRYTSADLSEKATAGFLSRAEKSSLNFPDGFLDAVRRHLNRHQRSASQSAAVV
jgi:DNA (cytosine-5)-methyltransferase 1